MRYRIILLLLSSVFLLIFGITEVRAERVVLDVDTVAKGYTVDEHDGEFLVAVPATDVNKRIRVFSERKKRKQQPIPRKYRRIGKSYYYKIKGAYNEPVTVSLKYNPDKARDNHARVLAYWNRKTEKWKRLTSDVDEENNIVTATVPQKRAKVIVLERRKANVKTADSDAVYLSAPAAVAMDEESGIVILGKNMNQQRSMASLTKVMTALIFLESNTAWDKEVIISAVDMNYKAYSGIRLGDTVTAKDLFYGTLVASDNTAAWALQRSTGMTRAEFVNKMNEKAQELGLEKTVFTEPSGIDPGNKTTAYEYALLARHAFDDPDMLEASTTKIYYFQTKDGRWCRARNTNTLIRYGTDLYITGAKTGFLYEAGYCLMLKTKSGQNELITVTLGGESSWARFNDHERLAGWAWDYAY